MYISLAVLGPHCYAQASLVAECRLQHTASAAADRGLWSLGSAVVTRVLSCPTACEIFWTRDQSSGATATLGPFQCSRAEARESRCTDGKRGDRGCRKAKPGLRHGSGCCHHVLPRGPESAGVCEPHDGRVSWPCTVLVALLERLPSALTALFSGGLPQKGGRWGRTERL